MLVERRRCGVNGAERGSGRGPWTLHVSFRDEAGAIKEVLFELRDGDGSSSKYAEPEADGVSPVLRSTLVSWSACF